MKSFKQHFDDLISSNPYYARLLTKLKKSERPILDAYIESLGQIECPQAREMRINRLFLDKTEKPRNYLTMLDLLGGANSRACRELFPPAERINQGQFYR